MNFLPAFTVSLALIWSSAAQAQHYAFVTSETGTADLSSWASSDGLEGLEAADRICQQNADAAGLPGTFVAALSDATDDAYCRMHGLSGKRADNCGMGALPNDAGPWVRPDGYPLGKSFSDMIAGRVWVPVQIDENGERVSFDYWTGSFGQASVDTNGTCDDWTSASTALFGSVGDSYGTTVRWLNRGSSRCDQLQHLLCVEPGAGPPVSVPATDGALVFLERGLVAADFGSLEAADAICQQEAADAGLPFPESFIAWLSDSNTDAIDRFTWDGPWKRLDGVLVAHNQADLTDGILFAPINLTEDGDYRSLVGAIWTSTKPDGTRTATHCKNWTSTSADDTSERLLSPATSRGGWTLFNTLDGDQTWECRIEAGFYCFAQEAIDGVVFADDFEQQ